MGDPVSMIGMGMSLVSGAMGAAGDAAAQQAGAKQAANSASAARAAADQTDVQLREELRTTIGNIDAIRAAAGTDPFAPTALAVKDEERRVSGRERKIRMANGQAQARAYDDTAKLRAQGAQMSLLGGGLKTGMGLVGMARQLP
jgi:hypothetical protein